MAREYYIQTKRKDYMLFDEWITKLEMRCFGWVYKGWKSEDAGYYNVDINWDEGTATATRAFHSWIEFKRIKPYSYNFFFKLLELCMSITSWIRRKLIYLLWFITAAALVIGIIQTVAEGRMAESLVVGLVIMTMVYGPSLMLCLCGWGFRKIFKIDKKLRYNLEKNGYDPDQRI